MADLSRSVVLQVLGVNRQAKASIDEVNKEADALEARKPEISLFGENKDALAKIAAVDSALNTLSDRTIHVGLDIDHRALDALGTQLQKAFSFTPTIDEGAVRTSLVKMRLLMQQAGVSDFLDTNLDLGRVQTQLQLLKRYIQQSGLTDYLDVNVDQGKLAAAQAQIRSLAGSEAVSINPVVDAGGLSRIRNTIENAVKGVSATGLGGGGNVSENVNVSGAKEAAAELQQLQGAATEADDSLKAMSADASNSGGSLRDLSGSAGEADTSLRAMAGSAGDGGGGIRLLGLAAAGAGGWFGGLTNKVTLFGGALGALPILGAVTWLHLLADAGVEILAVVIPALIGLAAFGIPAADVVHDIALRMQDASTASKALGTNIYPLNSSLTALENAVRPEVYTLFGEALNGISGKMGVLGQLATSVGAVLDQLGARAVAAIQGSGFTTFLGHAASDLQGLGTIVGNVFGILGNLLKAMPGYAEVLLHAFVDLTGAIEALTASPIVQWFLRIGLAAHGAILYVGALTTALLYMAVGTKSIAGPLTLLAAGMSRMAGNTDTAAASLDKSAGPFARFKAAMTDIGSSAPIIGTKIGGFGKDAEDAGAAADKSSGLTRKFGAALALLPSIPVWGWVTVGIIALGGLAYWISQTKDSTQQLFDKLEANIAAQTTFNGVIKSLTNSIVAMQGNTKQLNQSIAESGDNARKGSVVYDEYHRQLDESSSSQMTFNDQVKLAFFRQAELIGSFGNLNNATYAFNSLHLKASDIAKGSAQQWKQDTIELQGYQSGMLAMTDNSLPRANAAMNALSFAQKDQFQNMQKLTQAQDVYINTLVGGEQTFTSLAQALNQMSNDSRVAGASIGGLNSQSLTLANDYYTSAIPAAQKNIDALEMQNISTKSLTTVVATQASGLLQVAGNNQAARSAIIGLINNALGPGTVNFQNLNKWVNTNTGSLSQYQQIVGQAAVSTSKLASATQSQLLSQFQQATLKAAGVTKAVENLGVSMVNTGNTSGRTQQAFGGLVNALVRTGGWTQAQASAFAHQLDPALNATAGASQALGGKQGGAASQAAAHTAALHNLANTINGQANPAFVAARKSVNDLASYFHLSSGEAKGLQSSLHNAAVAIANTGAKSNETKGDIIQLDEKLYHAGATTSQVTRVNQQLLGSFHNSGGEARNYANEAKNLGDKHLNLRINTDNARGSTDHFKGSADNAKKSTSDFGTAVHNSSQAVNLMGGNLSKLETAFNTVFGQLTRNTQSSWNSMWKNLEGSENSFITFAGNDIGRLRNSITASFAQVEASSTNSWNNMWRMLEGEENNFIGYAASALSRLRSSLNNVFGQVSHEATTTWNNMWRSMEVDQNNFNAFEGNMLNRLHGAINNTFGAIRNENDRTWQSFWTDTENIFRGAYDFHISELAHLESGYVNTFTSIRTKVRALEQGMWSDLNADFQANYNRSVTDLRNLQNAYNSYFGTIRKDVDSTYNQMWGDLENEATGGVRKMSSDINPIQQDFYKPFQWIVQHVIQPFGNIWNTLDSSLKLGITQFPAVRFSSGGKVPGAGIEDTVPAMLTPGERVLSVSQVDKLGGHKVLDTVLSSFPRGGHGSRGMGKADGGEILGFAGGGTVPVITIIGDLTAAAHAQNVQGLSAGAFTTIANAIDMLPGSNQSNVNNLFEFGAQPGPATNGIVNAVRSALGPSGEAQMADALIKNLITPVIQSAFMGVSGETPSVAGGGGGGAGGAVTASQDNAALMFMMGQIGHPYSQTQGRFGPQFYDCSGLVYTAWSRAGVTPGANIADTEAEWFARLPGATTIRQGGQVARGDVVFFAGADPGPSSFGGIGHVGMAMSPTQYVSAYDTAEGVTTKPITDLVVAIRPEGGSGSGGGGVLAPFTGSGGGGTGGFSGTGGQAVYTYLLNNVFGGNRIAAAGATASIWGESTWNPESAGSGGRGLIGWTPASTLPNYAFTGNAAADMAAQLPLIRQFIQTSGDWGVISNMMRAGSVAQAAQEWGVGVERFGVSDIHSTGIALATQIAGLANGGIINEPIFGVGASGRPYMFGENGSEMVIPMDGPVASASAGGGDTYIAAPNFNGVVGDPIAVGLQIQQILRRFKKSKGNIDLGFG